MQANDSATPDPGRPAPPFPPQPQEPPGAEGPLRPRADHGTATYVGHGRLTGKAALITGGDSGIGKAVAIAFAREGADVLLSFLDGEEEDAVDTAHWIHETGRKAVLVPGDIGRPSHCRELVRRAVEAFGGIDILVNNAATQTAYPDLESIPEEAFEATFRTNLFSMFYLVKAALPHLRPRASIINTASIEAFLPQPALLPYSSTKGAIVTFTKALAGSLAERGIRVNAVAPGPVWTPLIPSSFPEAKVAGFGTSTPMGRPAQPAELAPIYVLLASDEASFMSGGIHEVTGGRPLT